MHDDFRYFAFHFCEIVLQYTNKMMKERSILMAKNFGKFLLFSAAAGAAAAGIYYYLQKKDQSASFDDDTDDDDFDDFDDDLDSNDSAETTSTHADGMNSAKEAGRTYVSLNLDDNKEKDTSVNNSPVADSDDNDSYDESLEAVEEFFDDDDNSSDMV